MCVCVDESKCESLHRPPIREQSKLYGNGRIISGNAPFVVWALIDWLVPAVLSTRQETTDRVYL